VGGEFSAEGFFQGENFPRRVKFPGVNFSGEILRWGNFLEFLYETLLMTSFLYVDSILRVEMLSVTVWGEGGGIFPKRCSQISWHYLKNDQKLKLK